MKDEKDGVSVWMFLLMGFILAVVCTVREEVIRPVEPEPMVIVTPPPPPPVPDNDWEWLRQGATMFHDDGTRVRGGPTVFKPTRYPVKYVPRKPPGATTQARDPGMELWDAAYEIHGHE
jgi:hypothetical protein